MRLEELRKEVDLVDHELIHLMGRRLSIVKSIAQVKKDKGMPIRDEQRERQILELIRHRAQSYSLSAPIMEEIFALLLEYMRIEMLLEQGGEI